MAKYRICITESGEAFIQRRILGIWFSERDPLYQSGGHQPARKKIKMYSCAEAAQDEIRQKRKRKQNRYPKVIKEYEV